MSRNAKTGLILASIAAAWFVGVVVKYWVMGG
ncbi:MAG: cytochrome oxidase small assembly protein [Betaproteobacteria bacterium]|nr:cytochrome oxidase small assembly protein [Betaproteobacteria bacterium]MDH4325918.1 cytochrome oxidase small assembly protein [Betaproteobacteria bacterium]MDH5210588.1 cytochrome oxidase small assembly protein [Betaproteobacteria bacterium]MDH5576922.1 cytochrome oxidase small assembly protein [Betaproteobacteria bacterium]